MGEGVGGRVGVGGAEEPGVGAQARRQRVANRARRVITALFTAQLRLADRADEIRVVWKTLHFGTITPNSPGPKRCPRIVA